MPAKAEQRNPRRTRLVILVAALVIAIASAVNVMEPPPTPAEECRRAIAGKDGDTRVLLTRTGELEQSGTHALLLGRVEVTYWKVDPTPYGMRFDCYLSLQDGRWKVDSTYTRQ